MQNKRTNTMRINDILKDYDEFNLATGADNDELISFYHAQQMQTQGLQIFYDRGKDFFKFLNVQGDNSFVIIYRDSNGVLNGVGTITTRKQYINSQLKNTLYLGDLRAKASREVSKKWKTLYSKLMFHLNEIEEFSSPYNFTVIMNSNLKAIKSLVKGQNDFDYVFLSKFKMTNVFCKIPLFPLQSKYSVTNLKNIKELKDFLDLEGRKYQLGIDYDLFLKRFEIYQGLKTNDVLVIRDGDRIIASCILWQPSPIKKIILKNLPRSLQLFNRVLSLMTLAPKINEELKILYINDLIIHSEFDRKDILMSLYTHLHKKKFFSSYHSIAFANFEKTEVKLKGFLSDDTNLLLYTVRAPKNSEILSLDDKINFNLSWV